jgi:hypothetical protein
LAVLIGWLVDIVGVVSVALDRLTAQMGKYRAFLKPLFSGLNKLEFKISFLELMDRKVSFGISPAAFDHAGGAMRGVRFSRRTTHRRDHEEDKAQLSATTVVSVTER